MRPAARQQVSERSDEDDVGPHGEGHVRLPLGHSPQRHLDLAQALDGLVVGHGADLVGELDEDDPGRHQVGQGLRMARVASDPAGAVGHLLVQVADPGVAFLELGGEPLQVRGHRAPQGLGAVLGRGPLGVGDLDDGRRRFRNRFLVKGSGAVWSPDGTRIAYVAEGEPKGAQIFVRWMDAEGATSQVTRVPEGPGGLQWSPDGKWIGFMHVHAEVGRWDIDMPAAPDGRASGPRRRAYVTPLHYRPDRRDSPSRLHHLFIVPADGGTARELTTGDWNVGARFDGLAFGGGGTGCPTARPSSPMGSSNPRAT